MFKYIFGVTSNIFVSTTTYLTENIELKSVQHIFQYKTDFNAIFVVGHLFTTLCENTKYINIYQFEYYNMISVSRIPNKCLTD